MAIEGTSKIDIKTLTATIVSAYVSHNNVPTKDLPALIQSSYDQLLSLGQPAMAEPPHLVPPIPIKRTVTPDHIISLEDGRPYRMLKRHLAGLGLTPEDYRRKWGLPPDYPMVAATYAARRSEVAKVSGLGKNRQKR